MVDQEYEGLGPKGIALLSKYGQDKGFFNLLVNIGNKSLPNRYDAEDAAQEFIALVSPRRVEGYIHPISITGNVLDDNKLRPYLIRGFKRYIIDILRKKKREPFNETEAIPIEMHGGGFVGLVELIASRVDPLTSTPYEILENKEEVTQVRIAINKLPDYQKEVVEDFYNKGMLYREIAKKRDIKPTTVRTRLHAARKRLANKLKKAA